MIFQSSDPEPIYPVVDIYHYLESNPFNVQPGKTVFIDPITEKSLTFGQFQNETKHFAAGLQDSYGFQPKDVLAIFSYNQVRLHPFLTLCYGCTLLSSFIPFFPIDIEQAARTMHVLAEFSLPLFCGINWPFEHAKNDNLHKVALSQPSFSFENKLTKTCFHNTNSTTLECQFLEHCAQEVL